MVFAHQAVEKNQRNPDFKGTAVMVTSKLDAQGGLIVGDFAKWTAEQQKTEAFTLKQQRLYAEEVANAAKARGEPKAKP